MIKLLDKPLKAFIIYASVVLLCSIPAYFFIIDWIWIHEVNEHNLIASESAKQNLRKLRLNDREMTEAVALWSKLQPETKIQETAAILPDSTYNIYRYNSYIPSKGYDRFHGLVSYFELNGKYYSLTVETNIEESHETIFAITGVIVLFFIILLIGFIRLNKIISAKLWEPFDDTLAKIKAFDLQSQHAISFKHSGITEFEEMNSSINKLVEGNVAAFRQQKEFTENASHELQTPMAIVQGKLELLFQDDAITQNQYQTIEQIQSALSRVSRINKNLLLLAKIENQQFSELQDVCVGEVLKELIDLLADFTISFDVHLDIQKDLRLKSNKVLLEILITNLIMNAVRHSSPESQIRVLLDKNMLQISNTGTSPLIKDKLFRRFSTASEQKPGSGLGLSIVSEVCRRYRWDITYHFIDGMHHFVVCF